MELSQFSFYQPFFHAAFDVSEGQKVVRNPFRKDGSDKAFLLNAFFDALLKISVIYQRVLTKKPVRREGIEPLTAKFI